MSTAKTYPVTLSGTTPQTVSLPTGITVAGAHYQAAPAEQVLLATHGDQGAAPLQRTLHLVRDNQEPPAGGAFSGSYLLRGVVTQLWLVLVLVLVLGALARETARAEEEDCRTKSCPAGQTCQAFEKTITSSRGAPDVTVTVYKCAAEKKQ